MRRAFVLATHTTALLILAVFSLRLWRNLRFFDLARRRARLAVRTPRVSVLVPARNESATIAACIESLLAQDYPDFEVMVLDDQSSDETGSLLDLLAERHPHLTVIHSSDILPKGWNGKSYACQRLAERASGDWLLFTDADTLHTPTSIAQGVAQAIALNADLLSAFPQQITRTWSERIVVSFIVDFLPLIGLDLGGMWRGSGGIAANGQYLLVRAETYHMIGGHKAIASALVDDFALASRVRSLGYTVAFVDGTSLLRCRMYGSAHEVWDGFSKNILLGLESSSARKSRWWLSGLFAWGYASVFVLPFLLLFADDPRQPLFEIGWLAVLRGLVSRRFARPADEIATTPLGAWSVMALGLSALIRRYRGQPIRWKGRDYPLAR